MTGRACGATSWLVLSGDGRPRNREAPAEAHFVAGAAAAQRCDCCPGAVVGGPERGEGQASARRRTAFLTAKVTVLSVPSSRYCDMAWSPPLRRGTTAAAACGGPAAVPRRCGALGAKRCMPRNSHSVGRAQGRRRHGPPLTLLPGHPRALWSTVRSVAVTASRESDGSADLWLDDQATERDSLGNTGEDLAAAVPQRRTPSPEAPKAPPQLPMQAPSRRSAASPGQSPQAQLPPAPSPPPAPAEHRHNSPAYFQL